MAPWPLRCLEAGMAACERGTEHQQATKLAPGSACQHCAPVATQTAAGGRKPVNGLCINLPRCEAGFAGCK